MALQRPLRFPRIPVPDLHRRAYRSRCYNGVKRLKTNSVNFVSVSNENVFGGFVRQPFLVCALEPSEVEACDNSSRAWARCDSRSITYESRRRSFHEGGKVTRLKHLILHPNHARPFLDQQPARGRGSGSNPSLSEEVRSAIKW